MDARLKAGRGAFWIELKAIDTTDFAEPDSRGLDPGTLGNPADGRVDPRIKSGGGHDEEKRDWTGKRFTSAP